MSRLEQSDRVLNFNILMGFSAVQCGVKYRDFVSDYRILCDCGLECSERFGLDIVTVMSDPMRETEGYGAKIVIPEDGIPYSPTPLISDITRWEQVVHRFNPHEGHRCEENIKAVEYYRRHVSDGRLIAGWVEGAVAECCDLRGFGDFLTDLASEDHSLLHALLSTICEQAKDYALAQVEAGADIIGIGDAASSQISPRMFREFAFPYQKAIVDAVHAAGMRSWPYLPDPTAAPYHPRRDIILYEVTRTYFPGSKDSVNRNWTHCDRSLPLCQRLAKTASCPSTRFVGDMPLPTDDAVTSRKSL